MRKLVDVNPFRRRNSDDWQPEEERYKNIWATLTGFWSTDWRIWAGLLVVLLIVWKLLMLFDWAPSPTFPLVDKDKWQAVFLSDGQVYFGHLREKNWDYAVLKKTYYFRAADQQPAKQQQQINLVKLGNELHGPEDEMYIPKNQILYWENLKSDSQVVRIISQLEGGR